MLNPPLLVCRIVQIVSRAFAAGRRIASATLATGSDGRRRHFVSRLAIIALCCVQVLLLSLVLLARGLFRFRRSNAKDKKAVEMADELEGPAAHPELSAGAASLAAAAAGPALVNHDELSERVRVTAKRDPELAVNVLRIWLQESKHSAPQSS